MKPLIPKSPLSVSPIRPWKTLSAGVDKENIVDSVGEMFARLDRFLLWMLGIPAVYSSKANLNHYYWSPTGICPCQASVRNLSSNSNLISIVKGLPVKL